MSLATLSVILILISAVTHALVGAIMKCSHDKLMLRGILGATSFVIALPIALTVPVPPWAIWLKESFGLRRLLLAIILAIGLILMHTA